MADNWRSPQRHVAPLPARPAAQPEADRAASSITAHEVRAHLRFLSSDLMEGRAPGTRGGELAAEYIASAFEEAGLQPVQGNGVVAHLAGELR